MKGDLYVKIEDPNCIYVQDTNWAQLEKGGAIFATFRKLADQYTSYTVYKKSFKEYRLATYEEKKKLLPIFTNEYEKFIKEVEE